MRLRLVIAILAITVACLTPAVASQDSASRAPKKGDGVIVKGCLIGPSLQSTETITTDETGKVSAPLTYQLKGDKKLLKRLRDEHDGKLVEVTGILKSTLPQDSAARGRTFGKTRVTFGIGTPPAQPGAPDTSSSLPVLEVKSFDGSGSRCVQ